MGLARGECGLEIELSFTIQTMNNNVVLQHSGPKEFLQKPAVGFAGEQHEPHKLPDQKTACDSPGSRVFISSGEGTLLVWSGVASPGQIWNLV